MKLIPRVPLLEADMSRREWLSKVLGLSLTGGLTALAGGCHKRESLICSDPERLSDAENSLRQSLHYTEESPYESQRCAGCGFFQAAGVATCGSCRLLKGPVNPRGHCDSWSKANK